MLEKKLSTYDNRSELIKKIACVAYSDIVGIRKDMLKSKILTITKYKLIANYMFIKLSEHSEHKSINRGFNYFYNYDNSKVFLKYRMSLIKHHFPSLATVANHIINGGTISLHIKTIRKMFLEEKPYLPHMEYLIGCCINALEIALDSRFIEIEERLKYDMDNAVFKKYIIVIERNYFKNIKRLYKILGAYKKLKKEERDAYLRLVGEF